MYTKTGFKVPFGCCSRWNICDMGRQCFYKETDPEAMEGCSLYRRGMQETKPKIEELVIQLDVETKVEKPAIKEQLSLF